MRYLFSLIILILTLASANVNIYPFTDKINEARFQSLITDLRCPKCQNQNLADSDAPLAKDLKNIVYDMINDGRSDGEIMGFMVEKYGDFVLYTPPLKPITWFLWFGPFVILAFVLIFIFTRKKKIVTSNTKPLTQSETNQLNELLNKKDNTL